MRLEAIKSEQKKIFPKLKEFPQFYLGGGTALALQIGHRVSVDFDLFSREEISPDLIKKIKEIFKEFKIKLILDHPEQLSVKIDNTKIDFVKYDFPLVLDLIEIKGVKLIQVPEIALMKAYTLSSRGTLKDYLDLYFILKEEHTTLKEIKELSEKKYGDDFNFRLFLEQLVYLEDIEEEEIEFLREKIDKKKIKEFFEEKIRELKI